MSQLRIAPSKTRFGWIGTGVMGRSMCMHITLAEADRMELKLPGLALVAGLYQAVAETGHARDGTHSLQLALASMSGIEWNNR